MIKKESIFSFTFKCVPWNFSYKEKEDINHVSKIKASNGVAIVYSTKYCGNTKTNVRGGRLKNENMKEDDLTKYFNRPAFIKIMAQNSIFTLYPYLQFVATCGHT